MVSRNSALLRKSLAQSGKLPKVWRGFAQGLKYLLEHPEECREMGRRGREYALEHHTTEKLMSNMDMLYRSLYFGDDK
jgi:glycosyltransferase involved in cell wall biosynthesis